MDPSHCQEQFENRQKQHLCSIKTVHCSWKYKWANEGHIWVGRVVALGTIPQWTEFDKKVWEEKNPRFVHLPFHRSPSSWPELQTTIREQNTPPPRVAVVLAPETCEKSLPLYGSYLQELKPVGDGERLSFIIDLEGGGSRLGGGFGR